MEVKNVYIPDFETNRNEFGKIYDLFDGSILLFDPTDVQRENAYTNLQRKFSGARLNLICHSSGCNYGIRIASDVLKKGGNLSINKVVFIAPTIMPVSRSERRQIRMSNMENGDNNERVFNFKKMALKCIGKGLSYRSRRKIQSNLVESRSMNISNGDVFVPNVSALVITSCGDERVSPKSIKLIENSPLFVTEIVNINGTSHNPLLDVDNGSKLVKQINLFLK